MTFPIYYHLETKIDVKPIPHNIQSRLKDAITNRLGNAPQDYGKPLRGELKSVWSLRVGDYRVIYQLREEKVIILQIVHRRDAYDAGLIEVRLRGVM